MESSVETTTSEVVEPQSPAMELTEPITASAGEDYAPPAPAPEKLTRKQLGQLRRQYLTIVHGEVKACGHKAAFSRDHDPKNNCIDCWSAYFATSVDLDFIHTVLTTKGVKALVAMKGNKFTKMFHGFLSSQLLPALAAEIAKEEPAKIQGGTFGNGNESGEVPPIGSTQQTIG